MAKQQKRIKLSKISSFFEKDEYVQIVLKNGSVHFVKPMKMLGKDLQVKNAMRHILSISLLEIDEIWTEYIID